MAFGASSDIRQQYQAQKKDEFFYVLPENWQTVMLFLSVQTQWLVGTSGVTGLNYSSVEIVCKARKQELTETLLGDLQTMELAALAELNKSKD